MAEQTADTAKTGTEARVARRRQASRVEEITIEYYEDDLCLVKELKKEILSRGGWCTIMFLYREYDRRTATYRDPKISIRRYQKSGESYIQRSKFTISSAQQARTIAGKLTDWLVALESGGESESAPA